VVPEGLPREVPWKLTRDLGAVNGFVVSGRWAFAAGGMLSEHYNFFNGQYCNHPRPRGHQIGGMVRIETGQINSGITKDCRHTEATAWPTSEELSEVV
jgi:hypothetical protein